MQGIDKKQLVEDVAKTLYAAKICSYAQGMNIIKAKSAVKEWNINLGALARIWKVSRLGADWRQSACRAANSRAAFWQGLCGLRTLMHSQSH